MVVPLILTESIYAGANVWFGQVNAVFKTGLRAVTLSLLILTVFTCFSNVRASCSSPSFSAPQAFNTRGRGVATGDFNADGKPDVVAAGDFSSSFYLMLNNAPNGFLPPVSFNTGGAPGAIAVGDFNNDLKPDVVVANFSPAGVVIFLGDGAGSFSAPMTINVGATSSSAVAVGDFNNDQNLDIAVANTGSTVAILIGNGSGGFSGPTSFSAVDRILSIAVADFDIDGKSDLAVVGQFSNQVSIMLGNGSGAFSAPLTFAAGAEASSVLAQDFNNDGKPDLAISLIANMAILVNNGDGTFSAPTTLTVGGPSPSSVVAGDFNNDGKFDLAVGHNNGISVRFGDGAGGFGVLTNLPGGSGPTQLAVDDFDGDGNLDLAVSSYSSGSLAFLLNNGAGGFKVVPRYSTNSDANSVVAKDFNNDGKIDLAVANRNGNSVSVYLGDGLGAFGAARVFSVGPPPSSNVTNGPIAMAAADFNNDGNQDLITANFTGGSVSILLGDGAGSFTTQKIPIAGGSYPQFIVVSDFNLDGKADFALTRNTYFSNVTLLYGNGNGSFAGQVDFPTANMNSALTAGDLNGDGKPDLVVGSDSGGAFSVLLNNGSGGFGAPTLYSININQGQGSVASIADFSGDGKADVVVANYERDKLTLFLGNGTGALASSTSVSVGKNPDSLAVADFNGDGLLDLAVGYVNSGAISVVLNNGAGAFSGPKDYLGTSPNASVAASDFNGDGLIDVATEGIAIFLNSCSGVVAAPLPTLSISDTSTPENQGNAVFQVSLSAPSNATVTVEYQTSGQTAVGGADFQMMAGTLNFAPGETTKAISIPIVDDALNEFTERFFLRLHHPVNATIRKSQGTASILDSDPEPAVIINDTTVVEGNIGTTSANFNVVLSAPSGKLIKVNFSTTDITATAGSDYQAASSATLNIPAGSASRSLSILINGDTTPEPSETFSVNISNPLNAVIGGASAVGTIIDDDTIQLLLDTSGPAVNQAAALDSVLFVRDPFRVLSIVGWWNLGTDRNTRITIFAANLGLNPGETASAVTVSLTDANSQTYNIAAEDVRTVPNTSFVQVMLRLPDNLPAGACLVTIKAHGQVSNTGSIRIAP